MEGGILSHQFLHNAGEPYKFVIKTSTQPMAEAAPVIREALELLTMRANLFGHIKFNEVLSGAYMEDQRMDVC